MKKMCLTTGIMLILFGLFACSPKASQVKDTSVKKTAGSATIAKIDAKDLGDKTQLVIESDSVLSYTTFKLSDPLRLVLDFSDATLGVYKERIAINQGAVTDIIPTEIGEPKRIARLEIALSQLVDSSVRQEGQRIIIDVEKPKTPDAAGAPKITEVPIVKEEPVMAAAKEEPVKPATPEVSGKTASVLSKIDVKKEDAATKIIVSGDGEINANTMIVSGNRLVVDVPNTTSNIKPQILNVNNSLLKRVRIGQHTKPAKKVRIVLDLTAQLSYNVSKENNHLIVTISKEAAVAKKEEPIPAEIKEPVKEPVAEQKEPVVAAKEPEKPVMEAKPKEEILSAPKEEIAVQPEKPVEKPVAKPPKRVITEKDMFAYKEVVPSRKYTGKRISLDFQDADIRNVLRLIADVSGYNLAAGDDVKGKVTIKLLNVPWDQSLDLILKMNNLGYIREGNILRVATLKNIEEQLTSEAKTREAEQKSSELLTKILYVNYGAAKDFLETLKKSLSPRGSIVIEDKTNAVIVKDISKAVDEVTELVRTLDRKVPQVMIEARIVEADTTFTQELGVQWGADQSGQVHSRSDRHTGNYTLYGGGTKKSSSDTTYTPLSNGVGVNNTGYLVNLPAAVGAGSGGAIGILFSNAAKSFNLDFQLSALESSGKGKVLSNPKILALDNKEAYIQTGYRIPYESTSTQGTKTEWIDAVLQLKVTPHVTPDNHIMMAIKVEKNEAVFTTTPPSIATKEAKTDVLVNNGDTIVIGGIYKRRNDNSVDGVPWLSRIPILGWLFKKEYTYDKPEELVIFITPKITQLEAL